MATAVTVLVLTAFVKGVAIGVGLMIGRYYTSKSGDKPQNGLLD